MQVRVDQQLSRRLSLVLVGVVLGCVALGLGYVVVVSQSAPQITGTTPQDALPLGGLAVMSAIAASAAIRFALSTETESV